MTEIVIDEKYSGSAIDFEKFEDKNIKLVILKNCGFELDVININKDINLDIFINQNSKGKINFYPDEKDYIFNLHSMLMENCEVEFNVIDFTLGNHDLNSNLILFGDNSKARFNSSVLSSKENKKLYNVSFSHIGEKTYSDMVNYGVTKDKSQLIFDGISHIENTSKKAEAHQKAKIIVFDKECKAEANPKLFIDYDDIIATHSAAVGTLNQDHIFYLLSRGLDISEAKKLITFGYLKPILKNVNQKYVEKYENLIGELM